MFKIDKTKNVKINKNIRMPKGLIEEIERICKKEDISFTEFIIQALNYVLRDYKWRYKNLHFLCQICVKYEIFLIFTNFKNLHSFLIKIASNFKNLLKQKLKNCVQILKIREQILKICALTNVFSFCSVSTRKEKFYVKKIFKVVCSSSIYFK